MLIFEAQCTLGMRVTPLTAHTLNTLAHTSEWASVLSVWAWSRVYTWTNATWTNASVSVYAVHGIFVGVDRCMHGDKQVACWYAGK
jgi:hypothetical protein